MEQGSQEWLDAKLAKVSSSKISAITAKGKGAEFGAGAYTYAYELIAEEQTGQHKNFSNAALEWGTENEPGARIKYQRRTFNLVERVGFIEMSDWLGCSPDGFVGKDGIIEIKCPHNSAVHVKTVYTKKMPTEHNPQVQCVFMVTGRKWCDFVSYDPRNKKNDIVIIRVDRDEEYIKEMHDKAKKFKALVDSIKGKM